ncbi:MAG: 4-hydroxy-tetrahydrodipicolinate reductase, partial [Erysipelotrichaceae bacterium]|nr:4-hydroxy-tetrahydrodipicolinate reductase [Erysipelotrichaceae bacterium]
EEMAYIKECSKDVAVFKSGNMSLGVAVLASLAKEAVKMFPTADIEIIEKHHNRKLDVPSGTALLLADRIKEVRENAVYNIGRHENGKRTIQEIGIHSIRMGNEVGTHEIIISTDNQVITLKHESKNRALFAEGALSAAEFLVKQGPGWYNMDDIVNG